MKKKFAKLILSIFVPLVGIFFACSLSLGFVNLASAKNDNGVGFYVTTKSTFNFGGSKTISGYKTGILADNDAVVNITGGAIVANTDGVILDSTIAKFTMSGGLISENSNNGLTIWNGEATISGGSISSNGGYGILDTYGEYSSCSMIDGVISNNKLGGVYVDDCASFIMQGGTIAGNFGNAITAIEAQVTIGGHVVGNCVTTGGCSNLEITDSGKIEGNISDFSYITMSGGLLVGNIENCPVISLYGGEVVGDIIFGNNQYYSSSKPSIKMKKAFNLDGTIYMNMVSSSSAGNIVFEDYDGTTPNLNIVLNKYTEGNTTYDYPTGTIITFKGSSVEPDLSKLNISGFDTDKYFLVTNKDSSGNWTVDLSTHKFLPNGWKTEIASSTYMSTVVSSDSIETINFLSSVPSEYYKVGTLSTGLAVYKSGGNIAFIDPLEIYAPEDSSELFSSLSNLTNIDFSNFRTTYTTNMFGMFSAPNLETLDLSVFDTTRVTNMSGMFNFCSSLKSLDLSSFKTSLVSDMSNMFLMMSKLEELNLSSFITTNVISMSSMFHSCEALEELDISNFDTDNVTNMGGMFMNNPLLRILWLPKMNTGKVETMTNMFLGCSSLVSLDLSCFDTTNVTDFSGMFSRCTKLTSLDISGFTITSSAYIDNMLRFGSDNTIAVLNCPKTIEKTVPIITGSTLLNSSGNRVTSLSSAVNGNILCLDTSINVIITFDTNGGTLGGNENVVSSKDQLIVTLNDRRYIKSYDGKAYGGYYAGYNSENEWWTCPILISPAGFGKTNISYKADYDNYYQEHGYRSEDYNFLSYNGSDWYFGADDAAWPMKYKYDTSGLFRLFCDNGGLDYTIEVAKWFINNYDKKTSRTYAYDTSYGVFPTDPVREGYNFVGWYTEKNGGTQVSSTNTVAFRTNKTLYAHWERVDTLTSDWKSSVYNAGAVDMTTVQTIYVGSKPGSGWAQAGSLESGILVYYSSSQNALSFLGSGSKVYLPENSSGLFQNDYNFANLKQIVFAKSVDTSFVTNMSSMFYGLSNLTSISGFEYFDTRKVTNMSFMFNGCSSLKTLDLSAFETPKLEEVDAMFLKCSALEYLDIRNFDTSLGIDANFLNFSNNYNGTMGDGSSNTNNIKVIITPKICTYAFTIYTNSVLYDERGNAVTALPVGFESHTLKVKENEE